MAQIALKTGAMITVVDERGNELVMIGRGDADGRTVLSFITERAQFTVTLDNDEAQDAAAPAEPDAA